MRVKSPLPPIPFIKRLPFTCEEFTLPKISTSIAVFIDTTPIRRITSGLLLISDGRIRILSCKVSMFANKSDIASPESVREQVLANLHRPLLSNFNTLSCITSVYISNGGMSVLSSRALSTALAMLPTPDWIGRNVFGIRPFFISLTKKSHTFLPIFAVSSSTGENLLGIPSGILVFTTPSTFFGST